MTDAFIEEIKRTRNWKELAIAMTDQDEVESDDEFGDRMTYNEFHLRSFCTESRVAEVIVHKMFDLAQSSQIFSYLIFIEFIKHWTQRDTRLYYCCVVLFLRELVRGNYAGYFFEQFLISRCKSVSILHTQEVLDLAIARDYDDVAKILKPIIQQKRAAGLPADHAWSVRPTVSSPKNECFIMKNNNGGAAVASASSSATQELQKQIDDLKQQLKKVSDERDGLQQQVNTLGRENDELKKRVDPSPFIKDKPYQVDFIANGLQQPSEGTPFGSILKVPQTSPFAQVGRSFFRRGGSWSHGVNAVAGFTLEEVELIYADVGGLEAKMRRLQAIRAQNPGTFFNPNTGDYTAEQMKLLISLRDQFLPRGINAHHLAPNLINLFHGTSADRLPSVANGLVGVRSTDSGFFGIGVYATPNLEYAAKYSTGSITGSINTARADGCYPVVWCVAAVGVCYPVTASIDCVNKYPSDFSGGPLKQGYDCHCVAVNASNNYGAVAHPHMQYMEVVFDQDIQILPIGVLWMKPI